MDSDYPSLDVQDLDGNTYTIEFSDFLNQNSNKTCITIGRLSSNDIPISDPHKKISRYHCTIEWDEGHWWIVDKQSANGTFISRTGEGEEIDVRLEGRLSLQHGDRILILGGLEGDNPLFWQLTFKDPQATDQVPQFQPPAEIEYSLSQDTLFRISRKRRETVKLTPQENLLLQYMSQRNWDNNGKSVVCKHQELIEAVFGDSFGHISNEITRLVWGIRNKIELDAGEPRFLQTVRGQGYRLDIRVLKD